jgi:hypothetical protein
MTRWTDDDEGFDDTTIPCPCCHESPRYPHCGNYISEEDAPPGRKPWWIIAG